MCRIFTPPSWADRKFSMYQKVFFCWKVRKLAHCRLRQTYVENLNWQQLYLSGLPRQPERYRSRDERKNKWKTIIWIGACHRPVRASVFFQFKSPLRFSLEGKGLTVTELYVVLKAYRKGGGGEGDSTSCRCVCVCFEDLFNGVSVSLEFYLLL